MPSGIFLANALSRPSRASAASAAMRSISSRSDSRSMPSIRSSGSMVLPFDFDIFWPSASRTMRVDVDLAERHAPVKCRVIMIMRATQKKMMSKPVTSTLDGTKTSKSFHSAARSAFRPASRASRTATAPTRTTCRARPSSWRSCPTGFVSRVGTRVGFVVADEDVAGFVVPRRDAMAPPELAADAPVLDVLHPLVVGR